MTSVVQIRGWLAEATKKGASHLVVVCDTWDHEDYPVYVMPGEDVQKRVEFYNGPNMQKVMEVYSMKKDLEAQVTSQARVWNLD